MPINVKANNKFVGTWPQTLKEVRFNSANSTFKFSVQNNIATVTISPAAVVPPIVIVPPAIIPTAISFNPASNIKSNSFDVSFNVSGQIDLTKARTYIQYSTITTGGWQVLLDEPAVLGNTVKPVVGLASNTKYFVRQYLYDSSLPAGSDQLAPWVEQEVTTTAVVGPPAPGPISGNGFSRQQIIDYAIHAHDVPGNTIPASGICPSPGQGGGIRVKNGPGPTWGTNRPEHVASARTNYTTWFWHNWFYPSFNSPWDARNASAIRPLPWHEVVDIATGCWGAANPPNPSDSKVFVESRNFKGIARINRSWVSLNPAGDVEGIMALHAKTPYSTFDQSADFPRGPAHTAARPQVKVSNPVTTYGPNDTYCSHTGWGSGATEWTAAQTAGAELIMVRAQYRVVPDPAVGGTLADVLASDLHASVGLDGYPYPSYALKSQVPQSDKDWNAAMLFSKYERIRGDWTDVIAVGWLPTLGNGYPATVFAETPLPNWFTNQV